MYCWLLIWGLMFPLMLVSVTVQGSGNDTSSLEHRRGKSIELRTLRTELGPRVTEAKNLSNQEKEDRLVTKRNKLKRTISERFTTLKDAVVSFDTKLTELNKFKTQKTELDGENNTLLTTIADKNKEIDDLSNQQKQQENNRRLFYINFKELLHVQVFAEIAKSDAGACSATPSLTLPLDLEPFFDQGRFNHLIGLLSTNQQTRDIESHYENLVKDGYVYAQMNPKTCLKSTKETPRSEMPTSVFAYITKISDYALGPNSWQLMCMIKAQSTLPTVPNSEDVHHAIKNMVKVYVKGLNTFVYQSVEVVCENILKTMEANEAFSKFMARQDYYQSYTRCLIRKEVLDRLRALKSVDVVSPTSIVAICICGSMIGVLLIVVVRMHLFRSKATTA